MTVEIQAGDQINIVASAADVERVHDHLTATITSPALIRLRASETVLHIGVGDPLVSVALFLDAQGRPFFADGSAGSQTGHPGTGRSARRRRR